jgi:hypothetical protein
MRIARVLRLHKRRQRLGAGLLGLLTFAGGCGGGADGVAPMPVQPAGIAPPAAGPDGKALSNSPRARAKEGRRAAQKAN